MSEAYKIGRAVYDRAQTLAFPRYPGTAGDRRAISVVRGWFETAGLDVRAMGVDASPFAHRGIESLTLASGSLGPALFAVHSRRDHGTNLAPQALDEVARLVREIVSRLAVEGSPDLAAG